MTPLIVTCDEPPCPPLNGNNRKVHDIIKALIGHYELHVVVYPRSSAEKASLAEYWNQAGIKLHYLRRRQKRRHARAVWAQLSLPTVTRDFPAELEIIRKQVVECPETKVLIDLISGSPLCQFLRGGVVVSGHDCMSHFWCQMGRWAQTPAAKLTAWVRYRFALQAERKFYHLAHCVHVVSQLDQSALSRINPAANCTVIPLGGKAAELTKLKPDGERRDGLIWGNLAFPPIAEGFKRFLAAATTLGLRLPGWKLIGGLPAEVVAAKFPNLDRLGLVYLDRVEDIEAELGSVRYLLLPDLAGAGQKNRCLDGLRHGCCVVGLAEVFRDLPGKSGTDFIQFESPEHMAQSWAEIEKHDASALGRAGREIFHQHYTLEQLGRRWRELIAHMPPVGICTLD